LGVRPLRVEEGGGLSGFSVVEVLKVGFSGGVFLLYYLAYRLLRAEQGVNRPNRERGKLVRLYCWLSLCGAVLICTGSLVSGNSKRNQSDIENCLSHLRTLNTSSKQMEMNASDLRSQMSAVSGSCITTLEK
jgi:outer membrane murein-binding lipoprotein Lpp